VSVDVFAGYSPEQKALIDKLRQAAREKASLDLAGEATEESVRRLKVLSPTRRLYVNTVTRWWSSVAAVLFTLSRWIPALNGPAVSAGRRVLQPPALYPELRVPPAAEEQLEPPVDDSTRKAAALRAIGDGILALPSGATGNLSVENALQVEEVARWVEECGSDEAEVRAALQRISAGESLVQTMKRGLS
jgi:hypothetical protein